jgi:hypothetical protein
MPEARFKAGRCDSPPRDPRTVNCLVPALVNSGATLRIVGVAEVQPGVRRRAAAPHFAQNTQPRYEVLVWFPTRVASMRRALHLPGLLELSCWRASSPPLTPSVRPPVDLPIDAQPETFRIATASPPSHLPYRNAKPQ